MPRSIPAYPAPVATARFAHDDEGWRIATQPPSESLLSPDWQPEGGIGHRPSGLAQEWCFVAPATFCAAIAGCPDGILVLTLGQSVSGSVLQSATNNVVATAGGLALGFDTSAPDAHGLSANGWTEIRIPLSPEAGWVDLATGHAASAGQVRQVLAGLETLTVRGKCWLTPTGDTAPARLYTADVHADPRLFLTLPVDLRYEDGSLYATWPASPYADLYRVEVYGRGLGDPVVTLVDPAFAGRPYCVLRNLQPPPDGALFYVRVGVVGLATPHPITARNLERPQLAVAARGRGAIFTWDAIAQATAYDLRVTGTDGAVVADIHAIDGLTKTLGEADGLEFSRDYSARLRAVAGGSVGAWSEAVPFRLSSAADILAQLRDRLAANRPAPGQIAFNATTLPADQPGQPARVLDRLTTALALTTEIRITLAGEPELSADLLKVTGTADLPELGMWAAQVVAQFVVSDELALDLTMSMRPDAGWRLSDAFADLYDTELDAVRLTSPALFFTTFAHRRIDVPAALAEGLSLAADFEYTADLVPVDDTTPAPEVQRVRIGGAVTRKGEWVELALAGAQPLAELTARPHNRPAITLQNGVLSLTRRIVDDAAVDQLSIDGVASIAGRDMPVRVDIPNTFKNERLLAVRADAHTADKFSTLLGDLSADHALPTFFPDSLLTLAGLRAADFGFVFDPSGRDATTAFVNAVATSPWGFVNTLSVSNVTVELEILTLRDEDGTFVTSVDGAVTGTISLGQSASYTASLGFSDDDHWYLVIHDDNRMPAMAVLANFLGISEQGLWPAMPDSLKSLCSISLTDVFIGGNPFAGVLDTVGFRLQQTRDWPVAGKLTVKDWAIAVTVVKQTQGWTPTALLDGKIVVGDGENAVTVDIRMPIPPAEGAPWEVALSEDSVVHIPTIRQLIAMSGRDSAPLPVGIATLGGLDLDRLAISFDVAPPAIRHVSFGIATTQPWVIIPDRLQVVDVKAAFSVRNPKDGGVATTGAANGIVELMGTPVQVSLLKSSYESEWHLEIASGTDIHIPGYAQLASWLAPDNVRWYMPPNLPLAQGFDVGDVIVAFGGGTGTLNAVGFRLGATDVWPIIPGKLELKSIRAELLIPYPVTAETISGEVAGIVQILDALILLSATKPGGGLPWEFRGSLTQAVTIDLVQAANSLSGGGFILPTDVGLPAAITIEKAAVLSVPDTGRFHFDGAATFQDWKAGLGAAQFQIRAVRGSLDVEKKGADLRACLGGSLTFASLAVDVALQLGTGAVDTVLVGTLSAAEAGNLKLPDLTDGIATTAATPQATWAQVVPQGMAALPLSSATVAINFTKKVFALAGNLKDYASAFLVCRKGDGEAAGWEYVFAGRMGENFTFAKVIPALAAADDVVKIKDARLMVYSVGAAGLDGMQRAVATLTVKGTPQTSFAWPLPATLPQALPAERGVVFAAELNLTLSPLFGKVLEIGTAPTDGGSGTVATLGLLAVIDRADLNNSAFAARFPTLTLFSTVELSEITATYRPKLNKQLTLAAKLTIKRIFGKDYAFRGGLLLDSTRVQGTIALVDAESQATSVTKPFGVPGIELTALKAEAIVTFASPATDTAPAKPRSSRVALLGSVRLGTGAMAQTITGTLALADGTPVLVRLQLDSTLSVTQFFAQCLKDDTTWPTTLVDIEFLKDSCIYYYDSQADKNALFRDFGGTNDRLPDGQMRQHLDGFNIDARLRLTFYKSLDLRLTLRAPRDANRKFKGVCASASPAQPLDMGFIQIAGPTKQSVDKLTAYVGGPELYLDTTDNQSKFGFRGGLNFFGGALLSADISLSRNQASNTVVTGDLKGTVAPFGDLSVGFTYTVKQPRNELRFRDWPDFTWVKTFVDLVSEIRKLYDQRGAGRCGALVKMAKEVLAPDTSYSIKPDVKSDGDDLVFSFTGVVTVSLHSAKLFDLDLPPLDIRVPIATKLDALPGVLGKALEQGGQDLVAKLLASPEKTGLLLAVLFGPDAVAAALELICNSTATEATAAATAAAGSSLAAGGGLGAGGAAGAAAAAAALAAAVVAVAAAGGGGGGEPGGGDQDVTPGKPRMLSLAFDPNRGFVGAWNAAAYASFYEFQVSGPDYAPAVNNVGRNLDGAIAADAATLKPGTYAGRVRANAGNGKSTTSDDLTVTKPGPTAVALSYDDGVLTATCTALGPQYAYDVDFQCLDGTAPGVVTSAIGTPRVGVTVAPGAGRRYAVRARASAPTQIPGDWSAQTHIDLLGQPADVTAIQQGRDAAITWQAVAGAAGYAVRVIGADGAPVMEHGDLAADATACILPLPNAAGGTAYVIQVRAIAANQTGAWSGEQRLVCLPVPAAPTVTYDSATGLICAHWDAVAGEIQTYAAELRNAANEAVGSMVVTPDALVATSAGIVLHDRTVYQVVVRVATPFAKGDWSAAASTTVRVIAIPSDVGLSFDGDTAFHLRWTAQTDLHYDARLLPPGDPPLATNQMDVTGGETVFDDHLPPPVGLYQAQVRGRDPVTAIVGAWSPLVDARVMPSPETMQVSYHLRLDQPGLLLAQWPQVDGAESYEFQVCAPDRIRLIIRTGLVADADGMVRASVPDTELSSHLGTVVSVQARARLAPGSSSCWSARDLDGSSVELASLPSPQNLTLVRDGDGLRARWLGDAPNWWAELKLQGQGVVASNTTTGNELYFDPVVGFALTAGTIFTVSVWTQADRRYGAEAQATITIGQPLPYAREQKAAGTSADETGRDLSKLVQGMAPVEILATLAAAEYGRDDATAAVHRLYPAVAADQMAAMVMAVFDGDSKRLALALGGAGVPAMRAVPLVAALGQIIHAVRVAAALHAGFYTAEDTELALAAHDPTLSPTMIANMVAALWRTPWTLGQAFRDGAVVNPSVVAATVKSTFPFMPLVEGAVVLQTAGFDSMAAAPHLRDWRPGVTPIELAAVIMAVFNDASDRLAARLLAEDVAPDEAVHWVMAAYPDLSEDQARAAVSRAQG